MTNARVHSGLALAFGMRVERPFLVHADLHHVRIAAEWLLNLSLCGTAVRRSGCRQPHKNRRESVNRKLERPLAVKFSRPLSAETDMG